MGLAPGWRSPEFELIERGSPTTFQQWRAGRWGIFATSLAEFTPGSLRHAARRAAALPLYLFGATPMADRSDDDMSTCGTVVYRPEFGHFPTVFDPNGQILARWSGVQTEVGPDEPQASDSTAYILDDNGVIRRTYSFVPGSQHDFMLVADALEGLLMQHVRAVEYALRAA